MAEHPRILLSNDDGIHAEGLEILEAIAAQLTDDIWVAAPEMEQSGASHSLTLHQPVRVRAISEKRYAINGTPTDCVLLAMKELLPVKEKKVDFVFSGVNRGSNVGDDITYSGTIAAAMEGTVLGVPSIAFSQLYDDAKDQPWEAAQAYGARVAKQLMQAPWQPNVLINVNFPSCAVDAVQGVRLCPQGKRIISVGLTSRMDPKGRPYYWLGGARDDKATHPNVDIDLLAEGYITVTPLCLDLTDYKMMERLRGEIN